MKSVKDSSVSSWQLTVGSLTADVLDLRTLLPFDKEAIAATVKKTGKVLILHEDTLIGGIGGEDIIHSQLKWKL